MNTFWKQQFTASANHLRWMTDELKYLLEEMDRIVEEHQVLIAQTHITHKLSAQNLLHYLIFRSYDIREMQDHLHTMGLSSLSSAESHVKFQICRVIALLETIQSIQPTSIVNSSPGPTEVAQLSMSKRKALLGTSGNDDTPNLMVTLPTKAAQDHGLVSELLVGGMNIARINLAHDTIADWEQMVHNIHKACEETGQLCKIYMDLPGPKIRTSVLTQIGKKHERLKKLELTVNESIIIARTEFAEASESHFKNRKGPKIAVVGCTFPDFLKEAKVGHRMYFDDGKFECMVSEVNEGFLRAIVTRVPPRKPYLKEDKGINFPDSTFQPVPLTEADKALLPFVAKVADLVGYSFVSRAKEVEELQRALIAITPNPPALILKIERQSAVDHLAELLLQGMQMPNFGVMIARGDLGIEVGFERLSEIQEEILWMCEAAHTPVIWATQVLENLNKTGMATRAEISDVALASAADCIMLNKGDHILESLSTIRNIAHRIKGHMLKKRYILRPLSIARRFTAKN